MIFFKSKVLWSILFVIALIGLAISLMPKPIDMDLSKIGNGHKTLVFVYDLNLAVSNEQAEEINKARPLLAPNTNLLVAKVGDPNSRAFIDHFKADSAELFFFDEEGQLLHRMRALASDAQIRALLSGQ